MSNILLKAEHICKDYTVGEMTVHALSDVSFELYEKELVVILGPSGSGKSTMLNILGGIESVTSGKVVYSDHELGASSREELTRYRREHIGFVFQFYNLLPALTALENVQLASTLVDDPLDAEKLLDQVGLSDRKDHFPGKLSGGQQQRVSIARALCKNPDLLLCDEPTGALDSQSGVQVLEAIYDFNRTYGKTVVLITHNRDIAKMADRVFYFKDGQLTGIEQNPSPLKPSEISW